MPTLLSICIDGLLCRCPRCHRGPVMATFFRANFECPVCHLPFETASGEITGGMGINIAVTLLIVIIAAFIGGFNPNVSLPWFFAIMGVITIGFPILFYPPSRALWIGFLYLTGDHLEGD